MSSTATLATLEARVKNLLKASGAATNWANSNIDEGIQQALDEYSRAGLFPKTLIEPRHVIATVTPASGAREIALTAAGFAGLLSIERVWYPYDASIASAEPIWIAYELVWNGSTPNLFLLDTSGDGTLVARVYFMAAHTLNGLAGATATTFDPMGDSLLTLGAAGFCCLMRSVELGETTTVMAVSTPNYAALSHRFLKDFRDGLDQDTGRRAVARPLRVELFGRLKYWDPNTLSWR